MTLVLTSEIFPTARLFLAPHTDISFRNTAYLLPHIIIHSMDLNTQELSFLAIQPELNILLVIICTGNALIYRVVKIQMIYLTFIQIQWYWSTIYTASF